MNKVIYSILGPLAAIIIALFIGAIIISLIGKDPVEVYGVLFYGTLGNSYGIGQVLFKATPLIFTGLSVAFAFKAGLFNIGAEGQMIIGGFAAAWTGFTFVTLPWIILIPLTIIAAFVGGALWGFIAGYLKAKYGSHEVINTIMLNFIAAALASYLVNEIYGIPATIHTPEVSGSSFLLRFDAITGLFPGSPFNTSFLAAILCTIIFYFIINRTPFGYQIRTLGLNKNAAEYARMKIKKLVVLSMLISGGIAGIGSINFIFGYKHYYELGFSEGAGYIGIAVALIARNNPFAIIITAFFFGILEYGGLTINTMVPKELVTILQALLIILVITFVRIIDVLKIKFLKSA
ncbi:MAG: ABC transporter permease [Ignavibacteriae bacterium]|nr:MAG: ABC transporter permease [Ignavibacteriota bacterium]